jgi:RNA polymerase sigma factor (sigma-70 family)
MADAQLGTVLRHIRRLAVGETASEGTDRELLERFRTHRDEVAFAALVQRHAALVWGVCRHVLHHEQDAEDAWQATFIVLARNAAAVRKAEALASFLHGVAYRTALTARRSAATRRAHERLEKTMPQYPSLAEVTWRELQAVLDDEIQRLPEKYRAPIVLCCLEEKSKAEAAHELGWKEGTVASRLARARKLLQERLTRRGVTLSALLATATLTGANASPPPALVGPTVQAALLYAADPKAGPSFLSAPVAALVKGVSKTMALSKFKIALVLLLAAGVAAAGAGWLARPAPAAPAIASETTEKPAATPRPATDAARQAAQTKTDPKNEVAVVGHVLGTDGKPCPGAQLYYYRSTLDRADRTSRDPWATSAADGSFRFRIPRSDLDTLEKDTPWTNVTVVAVAPGQGPCWVDFTTPEEAGHLRLWLVKDDVPINGRVVDLEGRPIPGVKVRVKAIIEGNLPRWLETVATTRDPWGAGTHRELLVPVLPREGATTDADGRFRLTGLGRDRLAELVLEGPTIETRAGDVYVMTRQVKTFHLPMSRREPGLGNLVYYGATFQHAAAPTKPIIGTVRDRDTGEPLAGVSIQSDTIRGSPLVRDYIRTTSDARGRFQLLGLPKGEGSEIVAVPADGQPYFRWIKEVRDTPGLAPTTVDFQLKRGVWLRGRVTDKGTGKAVRADVRYFAFLDNPHLGKLRGYWGSATATTREDGTFSILCLPGRGLLGVKSHEDRFLVSVGCDRIKPADKTITNFEMINTNPPCVSFEYHSLVQIDVAANGKLAPCAIELDPGRTVTGDLIGPDGNPVAGARVLDLKLLWSNPRPLLGAQFTATALDPGATRRIFFLQQERQLGAAVLLGGTMPRTLTVHLQPCGAVVGRILGAKGDPQPNWMSYGQSQDKYMNITTGRWWELYISARTDKEGRFRFEGLIPGVTYAIQVGAQGFSLTLSPGETKNLGDVKVPDSP